MGNRFPRGAAASGPGARRCTSWSSAMDAERCTRSAPAGVPRDAGRRHHDGGRVPLPPPRPRPRRLRARRGRAARGAGRRHPDRPAHAYYGPGASASRSGRAAALRDRSPEEYWDSMDASGASSTRRRRSLGCVVHSIRAASAGGPRRLHARPRRRGLVFHMHVEEQRQEIEDCRRGLRQPPMALLERALDGSTSVHRRALHAHATGGHGRLPGQRRHRLHLPPDRGQPGRRHRRRACTSSRAGDLPGHATPTRASR